ncbi:energy transducer TonB [Helicobacter sp. 11S02596-1]|uniref:energy transducer TonB n=1 Tax=Helicobacter sp. 11S02596-1 TaxID=1476194 RepID=UPI000BA5BC33|nr:energy transducer TonB [Helicobacter sp. 11S02596-1]PAF45138.1 hypothetical protein BJI48_00795 [Helicobacter sp. 11S02596-1]
MQDKKSEKRFLISLLISILIHLLIALIIYNLNKFIHTQKPQLTKIDPSNLLILKRGHSTDPTKQKPGAVPPTLASHSTNTTPTPQQNPQTPPNKPSPTPPNSTQPNPAPPLKNKQKQNNTTEQKKQENSPNKALHPYQKGYIDPKNLSLLSQQQSLAFQSPSSRASINGDNNQGMDRQTKKDIDELYGEEFGDLGEAEKDFIENNLREIGRITQKYLEYPRTAAYLGQDGQNAVEFYLHPNGDITGLKILKKSGYIILDRNTLKTIQIAYKDYPRPSTTTLIRIRVRYFMYR